MEFTLAPRSPGVRQCACALLKVSTDGECFALAPAQDPTLPYEEASFDVVTCVVSIDYMTNPRSVMEEVCRVLKPGGRAIMSISNRCFPTKAVAIWLQTNVRNMTCLSGDGYNGLCVLSAVVVWLMIEMCLPQFASVELY